MDWFVEISSSRAIMRFAVILILFSILVCSVAAATRTVWDGVYTKEQAVRGQTAYLSQCARCHGEALLGGENSPGLVDEDFLEKWNGKQVGSLVELTRKTMPSDGPGKLSRRQCVDLIAYILSANGFPAGKNELETDPALLDEILIQQKRDPQK
jgi:mono/diheme cytochrome c family protein